MSICGNRAFELLQKIGFIRCSGTDEELKAAHILLNELKSIGVEGTLEAFKVHNYTIKKATLEVLEPYQKTYEVTGLGLSGNTPSEGLVTEFKYVQQATDVDLLDVKGKVVLLNTHLSLETYERLIKAEVAGVITYSGTIIDDPELTDLQLRAIRAKHLELGQIPGVTLRAIDAFDMVKNKATKVRMVLEQDDYEVDSHNVYATIPGTDYPEQEIAFMGHYDSVPFSTGVYDNGAGSVILMELVRHYLAHPPKRTLRFMWFGSEEKGLLGSKAYVANSNEETLKAIKLGINVDVAGPIMGEDRAIVTADNSLCHYIDYLAKEVGFAISVKQDTYSSDSIPFADKGIPCVNFCRFGSPGCAMIHSRYDIIDYLSGESLENTARFVQTFSDRVINSPVFPVEQKMPQNMIEAVDKYLQKKKEEK
ncbi:M28 family metallopeptidase [Niameybacter massiliensis]|uniref:M28 family metallopeptidase n=1 Tax=Niameybacter massiliensis TaxID=1658108 RepID=UPI0006B5DD75|nr:M28 family metallopeptidase [Niameybacter massiliensis]